MAPLLSRSRLAVALVGVLLVWALSARAEVVAGEYQIKAAFLQNFARFVEWPPAAMPAAGEPFVIGLVGDDPFGMLLTTTVAGQSIGGHPLQVRRLRWNDPLAGCQIVFIASSELPHLTQILAGLRGFSVLTVADFDSFARRGGMIELKTIGNRVRFDINAGVATGAGMHVSSKLLSLAAHVYASGEVH